MDHQYPTVAKIPFLDTGKFEQWQFRIQQYLQHEHYALWEVIEFGDSYKVPTNTDPDNTTTRKDDEQSGRTVTITTEDIAPRSQERGRKKSYRQGSKAEEKTPKALMAIVGVGWDWSYMANKGEDHALVVDVEAPTEFALMANTESKVFDNSLCSNDCKKNNVSLKSKIKDLTGELSEANSYIYHYKLAVAQLEGRLVEYKEREVKYIEKIRTLEMYKASNLKCIKTLDKELEELKLEKDGLDGKLAGLLKASKSLDNLIKDLSWTGLPEFVDDTVTDYSRPSHTVASTSAEGQNKDSSTSEDVASPNIPKPFVKFVKPKDSQSERKGPHGPSMNPIRPNMNGARPNRSFFIQAPLYETRPFLKSSAVKTQYRAPWVPTVNRNNPPVNRKFSTGRRNFPTVNRKFPTASRKFTTGSTKIHTADMGKKGKVGSSQNNIDDKGGCKITGKGTIKTDKLEFENVYFVKDLKYNLFSVSQICDNKNNVLFIDSECIVLGRNFKLLDDANILLRTHRHHNMYSIDLNNIVPHKDLTCLVAKATADECILWHRRLGHLNVKTMNKLRSDKVKEGVGYNVVPPPAADLYLSPKKDLSWTGLPEFVDDTVTDYSRPSHTVASPEFVLNKKACYNCGDFSHLANDCRKRVQRETSRSQNHAYMGPSHRSAGHRPHGAPMRPPYRSVGHRPHRASMRPSNRPAGHRPHGPSMNPIRPNMNGARPNRSFFIQAPLYETRPFLKSPAVKTQYRAPWVSTVNRNNPPVNRKFSTGRRNFPTVNRKFPTASRKFTTGSTKIHTADMGKKGKAVKSSACWT
nr:ribonuclease H-like domain-containing protein [Tanacetum cinerariifolium]